MYTCKVRSNCRLGVIYTGQVRSNCWWRSCAQIKPRSNCWWGWVVCTGQVRPGQTAGGVRVHGQVRSGQVKLPVGVVYTGQIGSSQNAGGGHSINHIQQKGITSTRHEYKSERKWEIKILSYMCSCKTYGRSRSRKNKWMHRSSGRLI